MGRVVGLISGFCELDHDMHLNCKLRAVVSIYELSIDTLSVEMLFRTTLLTSFEDTYVHCLHYLLPVHRCFQ